MFLCVFFAFPVATRSSNNIDSIVYWLMAEEMQWKPVLVTDRDR